VSPKEQLDAAAAEQIVARILVTEEYAQLAGCDLVVEAVFEDRKVKADVFRQGARCGGARGHHRQQILPRCRSRSWQKAWRRRSASSAAFLSPVDRMPWSSGSGAQTSSRTLACARLREVPAQTPIQVMDAPGFFNTRVITAYCSRASAWSATEFRRR